MALTPQQQTFADSGVDFLNSVFSQIPNADVQAVKAEIVARLAADATQTADTIEQTVGKGLDFVDAGIHLSTNAKAINIADIIDKTYNAFVSGGGIFGLIGGLIKLKSATKA